ncbi:MAG TPA: flagellar hook-basal body complex protein [Geminicoccus sp.]|jgi:flagellar basal-body rod protein FlgF|uniref:flagellar hook-basal body complex protein n=1 Tax=Geminicoccus sp. TaxID=2024832 RepID=UPI002E34E2DF|nr:flagellar hook-basal body complex protein [Geminicoccus sp.]HEX2525530.1 flagellar hook-basal body complex protein [Geminicoccus sp.]
MDLTGYLALGRGLGLQRTMAVLSNNIANVDSTGFRRQDLLFAQDVERAGDPGTVTFGREQGTLVDRREGSLRTTGGMLDLALVGQGWFQVQTQEGERLTRGGRFSINDQGQLVTPQNALVLDQGGTPLSVPPTTQIISVAADGTVSADAVVIGRIGVVQPSEDAALVPEGSGLYRPEGLLGPASDAKIIQSSLEGSNVQPVLEMTRLIEVVRAFEGTQKLLETHHDLARRAVDRILEP